MKEVKVSFISLLNIKGIKEQLVKFGGKLTTISGKNASGKTTIFDAFTWCLFGKDSSGRSDTTNGGFMIKTVGADGEPIPHLEHTVTVGLIVDGKEITFTRQLVEEWGTIRGQAEPRFKGNTTHYYVDGVEVNASKGDGNFEAAVAEVMPEALFRQITNPAYFPNLPWKEQRELLLTISGNVTLEDVADGNETYMAVINEVNGKDIEDYKKTLASRRKDIEAEMKLIPARISGIQMATPQADDYQAIEAEMKQHQDSLAAIDAEMLDIAAAQRKKYEAAQGQQQQIFQMQQRQAELVNAAKEKASSELYQANAKRREALARIDVLRRQDIDLVSRISADKQRAAANRKHYEDLLEKQQADRTALLLKWQTRNAETYNEPETVDCFKCPLCNEIECRNEYLLQHDSETRAKAREAWYAKQEADLEAITSEGQHLNAQIEETTKQINAAKLEEEAVADRAAKEQAVISDELKQLHNFVQQTPEQTAQAVVPTDIPEWVELQASIAKLQAEMETANEQPAAQVDTTEIQQRKATEQAAIDALKVRLATRQQIADSQTKIDKEQARLQELAEQKADLEGKEMAVEEIVHKQTEEIERRVNSLFQLVKFRMFEKQANGGERPTCIAMVNGVRYGDLNSAMKINAGLDIINTICAYNEVTAPIFIDNAEGVNQLQPTKSQVVRLVVTNRPLEITMED